MFLRRLVLHRTHIMKTVCQLDQDNADILCHGKKHLTQILRLYLDLVRHIIELCQLCNTVHQKCYLISKLSRQLLAGHDGILHHIMKHTCHDRFLI